MLQRLCCSIARCYRVSRNRVSLWRRKTVSSIGHDLFDLAQVLRAHEGDRIAIDTAARTYTGRLQWHGPVACISEADGTLSWVRVDTILGVRVFLEVSADG